MDLVRSVLNSVRPVHCRCVRCHWTSVACRSTTARRHLTAITDQSVQCSNGVPRAAVRGVRCCTGPVYPRFEAKETELHGLNNSDQTPNSEQRATAVGNGRSRARRAGLYVRTAKCTKRSTVYGGLQLSVGQYTEGCTAGSRIVRRAAVQECTAGSSPGVYGRCTVWSMYGRCTVYGGTYGPGTVYGGTYGPGTV